MPLGSTASVVTSGNPATAATPAAPPTAATPAAPPPAAPAAPAAVQVNIVPAASTTTTTTTTTTTAAQVNSTVTAPSSPPDAPPTAAGAQGRVMMTSPRPSYPTPPSTARRDLCLRLNARAWALIAPPPLAHSSRGPLPRRRTGRGAGRAGILGAEADVRVRGVRGLALRGVHREHQAVHWQWRRGGWRRAELCRASGCMI